MPGKNPFGKERKPKKHKEKCIMIVSLQEDIHVGGIMKYKKKLRKRDRKHLQWLCGKDGQNEMQGSTSQPEWKERLLKEKNETWEKTVKLQKRS
jgi:hypothetical protein